MPIAAFGGPRGGAVGGRTVGGGYGGRPLAKPPVVVQGLPVNTVLGRVEVFSGSGEGAPEFLEAVCSRLKDVLRIAHESELENHERQMAKIENEVHEASQRLKRLQNDQQATAKDLGMVELSRQPLVERIRHFEEEQLELEMQRVSQDARRAAIEKQIQDLKSKPGTGREAAEAALRAAQAKMKLLSEKRKLLEELSKTGRAPTIEVQELEAEMIAAEAEVIRHRQMLEESAGGEMVAELNRHLAEQSIDEAERRARLEWLESKTAQLKRSLEVAAQSDYENLITIDLPLARDAYAQTRHMQAELERRIRLAQPPAVSVLGGR
jgi:chromosome segregation ATPase